jgi:hypothetical protein
MHDPTQSATADVLTLPLSVRAYYDRIIVDLKDLGTVVDGCATPKGWDAAHIGTK